MEIIEKRNNFDSDDLHSYECKDLSYISIKDLNFKERKPLSFYRSDFRGSKFTSNTFFKNNFDLADFIGNSFINTEFDNVNFGNCEFKNGLFLKCQFNSNIYGDLAIHDCDYKKCTFENETFHMTMFNCTFEDCQFINCIFDQCSTENLEFKKCTFIKVEMSTMHAEKFKFSKCTLRDTYLGACFLGSYFLKDIDIKLINFKYRGEIVEISSSDYFYTLLNDLKTQGRFFEFLNLYILLNNPSKELAKLFCDTLILSFNEKNYKVLEYNIKGIFEIIEFYYNSPKLPFILFCDIYTQINEIYEKNIVPELCYVIFSECMFKLKQLILNFEFNWDYLYDVPLHQTASLEFHINDNSFDEAENKINYLFNFVNTNCLDSSFGTPLYEINERKTGSVIITVSTCLILALLSAKVVKEIYGTVCQIKIEHAQTSKEIALIESSKSVAKLNEVSQIVAKNQNDKESNLMQLYNTIGKDYIISTLLKFFL